MKAECIECSVYLKHKGHKYCPKCRDKRTKEANKKAKKHWKLAIGESHYSKISGRKRDHSCDGSGYF